MADRTFQLVLIAAVIAFHLFALFALLRGAGTPRHKWRWTFAIVLLPLIGPLAYVIWGHGPRDAPMPP